MGAIRKNQTVAYKQVSSADQKIDRQLQGQELDKEFIEKVSGSTKNRPELNRLIEYVRKGDPMQRLMLQMMAHSPSLNKAELAKKYDISESTLCRYIREGSKNRKPDYAK